MSPFSIYLTKSEGGRQDFCGIFGRMEYVVKEQEYSEYSSQSVCRRHKGAGKDGQRWKEG
jgi:hypothetical protein